MKKRTLKNELISLANGGRFKFHVNKISSRKDVLNWFALVISF